MSIYVALLLGFIFAISGVILLYAFILPEGKRPSLKGFFKVLHDLLNVRHLLIEKVLKFLYVLNTMFCIFGGFFLLFSKIEIDLGFLGKSQTSTFYIGLVMILVGPIIIRLIHESTIMVILLVKNTMEINQKLTGKNENSFDIDLSGVKKNAAAAGDTQKSYTSPVKATPDPVSQKPSERSTCPVCGNAIKEGAVFCKHCGTKVAKE